jgi:ATP-dependent helicase/nuclease subunit A
MGVTFTKEQQAVIDARKSNILVSAAAGSGKTAVLVERIIQMISEDIDIDHLLVVTFTKAAAAQMKEKITLAIQKKLEEDPSNKHLQKQETLIHNAQITTIDSFCQYVIRNNFNAIGLDPSFRVGDDGELKLLMDEVMQTLLEDEYTKAKEEGNDDFLFCMEYFGTGSSDKKVEEYIDQLYHFSMSMPWPEDWITQRALDYDMEGADFDELSWVKDCVSYIKSVLNEAVEKYEAALKICDEPDGPYLYGDLLESEKDSIYAALRYNTYNELFDGVRAISFGRLPGKKDDSISPDKKDYVQKLRNGIKDDIKGLIEDYLALPSDTILSQMKLCDRAVRELCRLTIEFKKRFDEKKREKQLIDFSDMEHFALQILVEHPGDTPSPVALEYRDFYREVLIDEYQDSNNVQELILKSISGEVADKSERFMVGDVKQSIYKFRLARPEIFMEKLGTYQKEPGASDRRIDLHMNFRSRKEVLEGTNYIFKRIMGSDLGGVEYDKDAELVTGASFDAPAFDMSPELILIDDADVDVSAGPEIDLDKYDTREKEALAVAFRIKDLLKEDPKLRFKDMVILLRSNAGWDDVFKNILEEQGIPAYIESKSGYFSTSEVVIMLNLLTIIDNPLQDIPLVSVMHSVIGGFSDEELACYKIAIKDEKVEEDSFYQGLKVLVEKDEVKYQKLKEFMDFIGILREMSVYTPVHELLQHIIDETGFDNYVAAQPSGSQRKANLDQLLLRAASFEKTSFKGLFHFIRYIENLKMSMVDYGEAGIIDENADVVRIMSIHKSKGLEFPVVFVSGLSKKFNKMDTKGDLIADIDLGIGVKCIDSKLRVKYDTLKRIIIADKMSMDSLGEELRVLYVALTRAKEKLIMTATCKGLHDKLDSAMRNVPVIARQTLLPYSMRTKADSYLDLILPSLLRHPAMEKLLDKMGIQKENYLANVDKDAADTAFEFKSVNDADFANWLSGDNLKGVIRLEELEADLEKDFDSELSDRLRAKFDARYPHENLKGLFTKTTVTELKKQCLEQEGEVFSQVVDYGHSEDDKNGKPKLGGAERGTAYHRIMELLDDPIYGDETLFEKEKADIAKVVEKWLLEKQESGILPSSYAEVMKPYDVATFLLTDLGKRMGQAFRNGSLMREKPFMMGLPASELDEKFPSDEMVLIQGIIDAFFIEDGEIVLLDYKTDRVRSAEELVTRYKIQLDYYKRAIEASTATKVKEVYIYSFALGKVIKL